MDECALADTPWLNDNMTFMRVIKTMGEHYSKVHTPLSFVCCVLGILLNLIHTRVLLSASLRSQPVNSLLAMLAAAQVGIMASYLLYIVSFVMPGSPSSICEAMDQYTEGWMYYLEIHSWLTLWLHTWSLWLSILMALLRCWSVRSNAVPSPNHQVLVAIRLSALALLVILASATLPQLAMHSVEKIESENETCDNVLMKAVYYQIDFSKLALANNCKWFRLNLVIAGIAYKILPCALLAVLSSYLIVRLRSIANNKRRTLRKACHQETRATRILLLIVVMFIATELPQGALIAGGSLHLEIFNVIFTYLVDILDMMSLLNSSTNILLYCALSSQYRTHFSSLFSKITIYSQNRFEHSTTAIVKSPRGNEKSVKHNLLSVAPVVDDMDSCYCAHLAKDTVVAYNGTEDAKEELSSDDEYEMCDNNMIEAYHYHL